MVLVADPSALAGDLGPPSHRDAQLADLLPCFKPLDGLRPLHAWVHGPPGSGKTYCVQHLQRTVANPAGVPSVFVNCRQRPTAYAIFEQVLDELRPLRSPVRALATQLELLRETLGQKRAVVILDELDTLSIKDASEVLHHLTALPGVSLVCIGADRSALQRLPESIASRLVPRQVLFPRYQPDECHALLSLAATQGLKPGACTPAVLETIVSHAYGDARRALAILQHGVARAEQDRVDRVEPRHLLLSNFSVAHLTPDERPELSLHHHLLLDLVRQRQPVSGSALEAAYQEACVMEQREPVAHRTVTEYLALLCRLRHLTREHGPGTSGWIYRVP